jgi:AAHS family 4-hydroxybenzoate transporter-like MFS transporter
MTRFLTGLGLGGVLPNVVALSSEYAPGRSRATLSTLTYAGVPIGALLSGLVGSSLIPSRGWQSVFYIGGLVPLAIVVYAIFALPESIRFIAARTERSEEAAAVIRKIAPEIELPLSATFAIRETRQTKVGISSLFGAGRTTTTVLLTLIFVCNTFGVYFFMSWLPVLMKQSGLSMQGSLLSTVLLNGGGAVGTVAMGVLIDRFGIYKVVTSSYLIGGVAIAAIGLGSNALVLVPALFLTGTCMMGAQTTMYAVAAMVYPTAIRATGVGSTMGWGRVGSIIGPLVGAAFVALHWSIAAVFIVASLPIFAGALFMFAVGRAPKNFETPASAHLTADAPPAGS